MNRSSSPQYTSNSRSISPKHKLSTLHSSPLSNSNDHLKQQQINIVKVTTNSNQVLNKNTSNKTLLDLTHSQKSNKLISNTSNNMQQQQQQGHQGILKYVLDKINLIASNPSSKLDLKSVFVQFDTSGYNSSHHLFYY